jgi:hypothetical protein
MDASPHLMAPTQEEEFKGDKRLASPQTRNSGFAYHAVPTNSAALHAFRYHVAALWHRHLCRRSQRAYVVWDQMAKLVDEFLPKPRILHPWPSVRFAAKHPR